MNRSIRKITKDTLAPKPRKNWAMPKFVVNRLPSREYFPPLDNFPSITGMDYLASTNRQSNTVTNARVTVSGNSNNNGYKKKSDFIEHI